MRRPTRRAIRLKRKTLEDEQTCAVQLAEEGMEEAEHEQMVEGARNPIIGIARSELSISRPGAGGPVIG